MSAARIRTATAGLVDISRRLADRVDGLRFSSPVRYVYNPLRYAAKPHALYLERFGHGPKEVVLVGMNPGPFGMLQTGVPFGEIRAVRDWMGIEDDVEVPREQHPKRVVEGFACRRSEVSGARLWGWAQQRFGSPERFFARFFVVNYCPLAFLEDSGRNRTPDKLPVAETRELYGACDDALRATVEQLHPHWVIGIGAFAEARIRAALGACSVRIGRVLHPSPASPIANRGWADSCEADLRQMGVDLPQGPS